jgi:transposase InsO family protein
MTTSYYADRMNLSCLQRLHPDWTQPQLAQALGRSLGWVKKWLRRFREGRAKREPLAQVVQGHSRARKHPPQATHPLVQERILAMRDEPPEGLRRTPGPEAILYYLPRDAELQAAQVPLPRSSSTIDRLLKKHGRIQERRPRQHEPQERNAPMTAWQADFKDVSSVPADPQGKQQHVIETLNVLDSGTSVLLDAQVRQDFSAEVALEALVEPLQRYGCPASLTVDRDPRWVGSPAGSDFPSALLRFCSCLGIDVHVCAPRHPQQNAFVERYHRSYQAECLAIEEPATLEQARQATADFGQHYNFQRPNQALSCGNQPPRTAFPTLPVLRPLPQIVDPDSWLDRLDGWHVERKVDAHGMVKIDLKQYYVSSKLVGHCLSLQVDAKTHCLHVFHGQQQLKSLPIKGLVGHLLTFEQFLAHMRAQARAQHRLRSLQERRRRTAAVASP